jgi:hypothetical protein
VFSPTTLLPLPKEVIRKSAQACLSRTAFHPRTHQRLVAQIITPLPVSHDPSIAGKMYNPHTGKAENIDSLLRGPDGLKWYQSLKNQWGRCTQGVKQITQRQRTDCRQEHHVFHLT